MGTSQSTPTDQTPNELSEGFVHDVFYCPSLSTPTDQASNQLVQDYLEDPYSYLSLNTPTNQALNGGPVQGFEHDLFYYPSLSTSIEYQTPNRPVQGYSQDDLFNYPPLSTPTDQTPNGHVQGFVQDLFYYPSLSTPTDQQTLPNRSVHGYLQDPINYPPPGTPTDYDQQPNGPIQDYNPPLVPTSDRNRSCFSCELPEHMQPTKEYINLGDGRYVCPKCLSVSLMESRQLEPIIRQVYSFFDNYLKQPVKKNIPIFFVDANEMRRNGSPRATGKILFRRATIKIVKRFERRMAELEAVTETLKVKGDKVPVILLLVGFHKEILGATLAHEMMHAVIGLQDWSFQLEKKVEEGICEAIASEWLEYIVGEYNPSYNQNHAKIAEALTMYYKSKIEEGYYGSCGAELWKAKRAIKKYGLKGTLKRIARSRNIPE